MSEDGTCCPEMGASPMTTPPPDAAAIAARLSEAQKRALLWLPGDGMWRGPAGRLGMALTLLVTMHRPAIAEREWDGPWDAYNYRATPLGQKVRALLREEAGRG